MSTEGVTHLPLLGCRMRLFDAINEHTASKKHFDGPVVLYDNFHFGNFSYACLSDQQNIFLT